MLPDPTPEIHSWPPGVGFTSGIWRQEWLQEWLLEWLQEWLQIPLLNPTPGQEWVSGVGSGARSGFQEWDLVPQEWLQIPLLRPIPARSGFQEWDLVPGVAPDPIPETHPRHEWFLGVGSAW